MTLEIYKITIFLICASIGIQFIEISGIVPDTHTGYSDKYSKAGIFATLTSYVSFMIDDTLPTDETYITLTVVTFGLLTLVFPFMLALFWFGYILGADFILKFFSDIPELKYGLLTLLAITYIIGYKQYQANISLRQF